MGLDGFFCRRTSRVRDRSRRGSVRGGKWQGRPMRLEPLEECRLLAFSPLEDAAASLDWDIGLDMLSGLGFSALAALNNNATTDTGADGYPQLITDSAGNRLAVWQSANSLGGTIYSDYDILFSRSTDKGQTWTDPAALNSNAVADSGHDMYPQVATDSLGNWVAVWESNDSLGGTIGTDDDRFAKQLDGLDVDIIAYQDEVDCLR